MPIFSVSFFTNESDESSRRSTNESTATNTTDSSNESRAHLFHLVPSQVDVEFISWCMMGFIAFTVVFEIALHRLEHAIRNHSHYSKILHKVYKGNMFHTLLPDTSRELMILGFISFILIFLSEIIDVPEEKNVLLEFVHIWIFFTALFFVAHALLFMRITSVVKRGWDRSNGLSRTDIISLLHDAQHTYYARHRFLRWFMPEPEVIQHIEFHSVKTLFTDTYGLPYTFDFAKYLRKSTTHAIVEHLDVKVSTWLVLIFLLAVLAAYFRIDNNRNDPLTTRHMYVFLGTCWLILFFAILVYFFAVKARHKLRELVECSKFETMKTALDRCHIIHSSIDNNMQRYPTLSNLLGSTTPNHIQHHYTAETIPTNTTLVENPFPFYHSRPGSNQGRQNSVTLSKVTNIATSTAEFQQRRIEYADNVFPNLFLWGKPEYLLIPIDILFLIQCLVFALVLAMTAQQAFNFFSKEIAIGYVVATVSPQIITMLYLKPMILSNFVFVHSVARVHKRTLNQVLEWMEETTELKNEFAAKIKQVAAIQGNNLHDLFKRMNKSNSGNITKNELKKGLVEYGLHLSSLQVSRLMRLIDYDQSGALEWHEFARLVSYDPLTQQFYNIQLDHVETIDEADEDQLSHFSIFSPRSSRHISRQSPPGEIIESPATPVQDTNYQQQLPVTASSSHNTLTSPFSTSATELGHLTLSAAHSSSSISEIMPPIQPVISTSSSSSSSSHLIPLQNVPYTGSCTDNLHPIPEYDVTSLCSESAKSVLHKLSAELSSDEEEGDNIDEVRSADESEQDICGD